MEGITIEKANYIIAYYSSLLNLHEQKALRHYRSTIKLEDAKDDRLEKLYLKSGWLSDNPEILNYLNEGYIQFIINVSERILKDNPDEIIFNLCPICKKLARTLLAKQCRNCGHDWH